MREDLVNQHSADKLFKLAKKWDFIWWHINLNRAQPCPNSGVTIGPVDPALQGGAKLLVNVGHFLENLTVVLAKVRVLG